MSALMKAALNVAAGQGAEDVNANVISLNVNTDNSADKPNFLTPKLDNIPDALKQQPWAVWIAEPRSGKPGKFNKAPRCPRGGYRIGANQPEKFGTFAEAQAAYEAGGYTGVGVLLTGNGIIGVDIDYHADTFKAQPTVKQWVIAAIKVGAYCEKSPSGGGLRLFMWGELPTTGRHKSGPLEIYDNARFLTVTGHVVGLKNGGV
jgi:putative DNA primase/helicase